MSRTAEPGGAAKSLKRKSSREITEEAIYSAAARLFSQNGYPSTTLEQIASEVGVHKSTIFHHVSVNNELLAIILAEVYEAMSSLSNRSPALLRMGLPSFMGR